MTKCENCGGRAQLFICPRCVADLREMLQRLPRWLTHLEEAAYGQVRFSSGSGRRNSASGGLTRYTDETPASDGLGGMEGQRRLEQDADDGKLDLRKVLAAGRVSTLACERRDKITSMLSTWIRDICETRGLDMPAFDSDVRAMARWLAMCVAAIAASPGAGEFYDELTEHIRSIERIINPPDDPQFIGPCPTLIDHRRQCGMCLMAKRPAIEVNCPTCKRTHNIEALIHRLLADVDHWRFTVDEILMIMEKLGTPVPERTFRRWRADKRVKPRGYRRPDKSIGLTRRSVADEALYRLIEVRTVHDETIRHADATCRNTSM